MLCGSTASRPSACLAAAFEIAQFFEQPIEALTPEPNKEP